MKIFLRAACCAALGVMLTATTAVAENGNGRSRTLSYESSKPLVEADSVRDDDDIATPTRRAAPASYNKAAMQPVEHSVVQSSPATTSSAPQSLSECASCNNWEGHGCGKGGCGNGCGKGGCCDNEGEWFGGAEYLYIRPHFSNDFAYRQAHEVNVAGGTSTITETDHGFDYGYSSSIRAFIGYRLCECGGEVKFTYWGFGGNASVDSPAQGAVSTSGNTSTLDVFSSLLDVNTGANTGSHIHATSGLNVNAFDIDFAKPLPLCQDCCSCCPTWEFKWNAGVRIADVKRHNNVSLVSANNTILETVDTVVDFRGAGPKMGLEGRRFFGECNEFSLFARGNGSLLLGTYDSHIEFNEIRNNTADIRNTKITRIIPVAELEVGGTWKASECLTFTGGYQLQAWWDLGMSEQPLTSGLTNIPSLQDSNILSFDGFFVRAEYAF